MLIEAQELMISPPQVIFDCRFSLADPRAGRARYDEGHIPGAYYLDLDLDLSGDTAAHGGRHPLPLAGDFVALLTSYGVNKDTEVVAYDDARFAFASRLWWLMRSLGYRPPRLLNGGYQAWLSSGGEVEMAVNSPGIRPAAEPARFGSWCDIDELRALQQRGALLVDSREERRYQGLEEPIDPIAGHIPGAINRPWQAVTSTDGKLREAVDLRAHWGDVLEAEQLVVYCGSGVTACVNILSLALLGREDATLYAGSWSDWCSYLTVD